MKRPLFIITLEGVHGCGKTTTNQYFKKLIEEEYPELSKHIAFINDSFVDLLPDLHKSFPYGSNYIREVTFFTEYVTKIVDLYNSGISIIVTDRCMKSAPLYEAAMCEFDPDNDTLHRGATQSLIDLKNNMLKVLYKNIPITWQIVNVCRPTKVLDKTLNQRNELNPHPDEYNEKSTAWTRLVYNKYQKINNDILDDKLYGSLSAKTLEEVLPFYENAPQEHVFKFFDNPLEGDNGKVQINILISLMCTLLKRCMLIRQGSHIRHVRRLDSQDEYTNLLKLMELTHKFHRPLLQDKEIYKYGLKILKNVEVPEREKKALGVCIFPSVFFSFNERHTEPHSTKHLS